MLVQRARYLWQQNFRCVAGSVFPHMSHKTISNPRRNHMIANLATARQKSRQLHTTHYYLGDSKPFKIFLMKHLLKIKLDPEFNEEKFMADAKQTVGYVSSTIFYGLVDELHDVLSPKAIESCIKNFKTRRMI